MARKLVSFDWAVKRLLRSKVNFAVLEGFLSELLKEEIVIQDVLESESNKDTREQHQTKVDLSEGESQRCRSGRRRSAGRKRAAGAPAGATQFVRSAAPTPAPDHPAGSATVIRIFLSDLPYISDWFNTQIIRFVLTAGRLHSIFFHTSRSACRFPG